MKKVLSLITIVVLILSLVACNNSQNDTGNTGNETGSNNNQNGNGSQTALSFKTLSVSANNVYGEVSNSAEIFSFFE